MSNDRCEQAAKERQRFEVFIRLGRSARIFSELSLSTVDEAAMQRQQRRLDLCQLILDELTEEELIRFQPKSGKRQRHKDRFKTADYQLIANRIPSVTTEQVSETLQRYHHWLNS